MRNCLKVSILSMGLAGIAPSFALAEETVPGSLLKVDVSSKTTDLMTLYQERTALDDLQPVELADTEVEPLPNPWKQRYYLYEGGFSKMQLDLSVGLKPNKLMSMEAKW